MGIRGIRLVRAAVVLAATTMFVHDASEQTFQVPACVHVGQRSPGGPSPRYERQPLRHDVGGWRGGLSR